MTNATDRMEKFYSGAVYDVLRGMGITRTVLPHDVKPIDPATKICGPVFTLEGRAEKGISAHQSLLAWTKFLSSVPSGSVVVSQPNDSIIAHMGELSAETLQLRGIRGALIDGGSRDTSHILALGFPVFCRYLTPRDVVEWWTPTAMGEPIEIGGVTIRTGDYIFGDIDGAMIIPEEVHGEVINQVEVHMNTENLVRKAILEGVDPQEAYLKYGAF